MPDELQEQKTVFISYRRDVASYIARAVFQDLHANGYDVFMDVESVDSGQLERIILPQIEARAHFLIILTRGTVKRCAEPGDWLRREIEFAMDKQRNIVPLLVDNFKFNKTTKKYLTGKLAELPGISGLPVFHEYFDEAMNRLRTRFLKQPVYGVVKPAPPDEQPEVERKIEEAAAQPTPTAAELSAEFYFNRGSLRQIMGDLERAITDYSEAIRLNPQYAAVYNDRGIARSNKGDLEGALADFGEAIRLNPQFAAAYNNRALALQFKGDLEGAMADYNEAIRLNPKLAKAYYNRGFARSNKGDLDGVMADFTEAIRLNPQDAIAYSNRGFARANKGDLDGAMADFTQAIRLNPKLAQAYYNRGNAREDKGDLKGAIADYQKYLDLGGGKRDGDQAEVEQWIRELQERLKP